MPGVKVVGVGLNKTGTKTLGVCLRYWGFRHVSCNAQAFELWRAGKRTELMRWVGAYDSFEDWPWPLVYREIDAEFPGSKFILTTRKDADVWFGSLCKHAARTGPTEFRRHVYGYDMPHRHQADHVAVYESHRNAVRSHFRNRSGDLLEVCWENGDGWTELAAFLGLEEPQIEFPHVNRS